MADNNELEYMRDRSGDEIMSNEEQEVAEGKREKKVIQHLKPLDFSQIELEDFEKNFY